MLGWSATALRGDSKRTVRERVDLDWLGAFSVNALQAG